MSVQHKYSSWLKQVLLCLLSLLALVGLFNYAMDPLWCFPHAHHFNRYQKPIDDRQQKTNFLFHENNKYDAILFGNSRARLIDQKDFVGHKVFNYAMPAMRPREYAPFLKFAKSINGDFKTIFIGLDFSNSNGRLNCIQDKSEDYISKASSLSYRISTLFSGSATLLSIKNILYSLGYLPRKFTCFDRNNTAHVGSIPVSDAELQKRLDNQLAEFENIYALYYYDSTLANVYRRLISENPRSRFIVYTTPVSKPLFCLIKKSRRLGDYERWLREMVDVFGTVYHFEYLHDIARNHRRFFLDAHHPYPALGRLVAHKVTEHDDPELPPDFGVLVTKNNVDEVLGRIRRSCSECR